MHYFTGVCQLTQFIQCQLDMHCAEKTVFPSSPQWMVRTFPLQTSCPDMKLDACIIVTHFERFKVQLQVKLSIFVTWFFRAKPTKKNQHLSSRIYTRCLAHSYDQNGALTESEARQSQQLLMFASSMTILCTSSRVTFPWALSVKVCVWLVACILWLANVAGALHIYILWT
jgi:hypothetical protein